MGNNIIRPYFCWSRKNLRKPKRSDNNLRKPKGSTAVGKNAQTIGGVFLYLQDLGAENTERIFESQWHSKSLASKKGVLY